MEQVFRFDKYKPPFPWFGGKSKVASLVWQAMGNVGKLRLMEDK